MIAQRHPSLSARELEILGLAADGMRLAEIADTLAISPGTVRTYLGRIYMKLGVNDRAAAVAKALRLGLIR